MKLGTPIVAGFQSVDLEEILEQREEGGEVVGEHKEVDAQQVGAGLQVAKGVARLRDLGASLDVDLPADLGLLPRQNV